MSPCFRRLRLCAVLLVQSAFACDGAESPVSQERSAAPERVTAQLERVVDGDTIIVRIGGKRERVRYIGIDTPELGRDGKPDAPFARKAMAANARLVEPGPLRLAVGVQERDRYGRLLAYVHNGDQKLVNAELLQLGLARVMTIPPNVSRAAAFREWQSEARREKRGMWGGSSLPNR